ncbi:MAG TPA: hypothetical protein VMT53_14485 [Terriglobales bacterium]|nr:hypothetical protein [Terriglobales bacterium]
MRVPISLNGKRYWYQLDTGADMVLVYGSPKHEGWSPQGEALRIPNVRFAGMSFPAILAYPMESMPDAPSPEALHGSVGLDALVGHIFMMDFPKRRICLFDRPEFPESFNRAADWSSAEIRDGKLFLTMELNGRKLDAIFYDTGSSADALLVDFGVWKQATGRSDTKDTATKATAQSWGQDLQFIGAPASGDLKLGNHVYRKPFVSTILAQPDSFRTKNGAQGLLGNALFHDSIIILDLGSHPQFGIIDDSR